MFCSCFLWYFVVPVLNFGNQRLKTGTTKYMYRKLQKLGFIYFIGKPTINKKVRCDTSNVFSELPAY